MIMIVLLMIMTIGTITQKPSRRGATKRRSLFPWKRCKTPCGNSRPAFIDAKALVHTADEPGRQVVLQVVGKRVDISGWGSME